MLDSDEWALANYLVKLKLDGNELPNTLPEHLIPPSKRKIFPSMHSSSNLPNSDSILGNISSAVHDD